MLDYPTYNTIKEAIKFSVIKTLVWYQKDNVKILFLNGRPALKFK